MVTRHLARMQIEADGPAVEGEWTFRLIEESDGRETVRKTWTAQGEVEGPGT